MYPMMPQHQLAMRQPYHKPLPRLRLIGQPMTQVGIHMIARPYTPDTPEHVQVRLMAIRQVSLHEVARYPQQHVYQQKSNKWNAAMQRTDATIFHLICRG